MLCICIWHILVHGLNLKDMSTGDVNPTYAQLSLMALLVPATNCFMLISGYYGIELKKRKLLFLAFQATFFYILILLLRLIPSLNHIIGEPCSLVYVLQNPIPLFNIAWWFLIQYSIIMVLSPIIEKGIRCISKQQFKRILIILLLFNCVGGFFNRFTTGSDLFGLLVIYLLGRYINIYNIEITRKKAVLLGISATTTLILLVFGLHAIKQDYYVWVMMQYSCILVIIQAIALFSFIKATKPYHNKYINTLGKLCFSIYLFTEFTDRQIYLFWTNLWNNDGIICMLAIIVCTIAIILIIDYLRLFLYNSIEKKLLSITNCIQNSNVFRSTK